MRPVPGKARVATCPSGQIARGPTTASTTTGTRTSTRTSTRTVASVVTTVTGAAVLALPAVAHASNPWLTPLGAEAAASGGAVAAMGRDTGMAFYNPAGLGANRRSQFDMSSTMAVLRLRTIPGAFQIDLPGGRQQTAQLASIEPLALATSTVYTRYMGHGVTVGAGHFANNFDRYDYTGILEDRTGTTGLNYAARVQVDGWATRHYFGPTVGWQIMPRLRIGMSLFITYEFHRDEGRIWMQAGPTPGLIDQNFIAGDIDLRRQTFGTEAVLGLQWEFAHRWHLGFAFRTPRLAFLERARKTSLTTGAVVRDDDTTAALFNFDDTPNAARRGRVSPLQIVLGIAYALPGARGWVSAEADYTPAMYVPKNNVDLRHNVNARIGARIRVAERVMLGLGLFTDRTNEKSINDFPQFNLNYYGGSTGLELRRPFKLGKTERARDITFTTAVAVRYAWGTGASGAVRFNLAEDTSKLSYSLGEVHPVQFHVWSGHIGAGLYF